MVSRRSIFQLFPPVLALLLTLAATVCTAQNRPTPLSQILTGGSSLSAADLATVKSYADYWTNVLKDSAAGPADVEAARVELVRPLTNPAVSPAFRFEYSKLIEPELQKIVEGDNIHRAVNAVIVGSSLGSDRGANFLLLNINKLEQPKWQIRLQAAYGCRMMLQAGVLESRKVLDAVKRLRDAAATEDHPIVLQHQLAAIGAAKASDEERKQVFAVLIESINATVGRVAEAKGDPTPMLAAVNSAVLMLRDKYMAMMKGSPDRKMIGQKLGPSLGQMLNVAATNWETAQRDDRSKRLYAAVVGGCQGFLTSIDEDARGGSPPDTKLQEAWNAGDKAKFNTQVAQWAAVLKMPPYTPQP